MPRKRFMPQAENPADRIPFYPFPDSPFFLKTAIRYNIRKWHGHQQQ